MSARGGPIASSLTMIRSTIRGRSGFLVSGFWSFGLRILGLLSTFGLGVVLARVLGPAQFGIYGLVTTVAALAMTVSLLGTPQLAVRELSIRSGQSDWIGIRALLRSFGATTALAALALSIGAVAVGYFLTRRGDNEFLYIALGALLAPLLMVTALVAAALRGLGEMIRGQFMDIFGRPTLAFLATSALVLSGIALTAIGALWIQVAAALLAAAISLVWIRNAVPKAAASIPLVRRATWLGAAVPLGAVDILRQLDGAYGVILIGWIASDTELGLFRVAIACVIIVSMPVTILHIILAPTVAQLYNLRQTDELQRVLSWTSAALVAMVVPIAIASYFIGRPAIELVFGRAYVDSWMPLFLLCLAQLVFAFFGMGPILLAMCEGERELIKIYVVSVGLGLIAAAPLIAIFGAAGAAVAQIVSLGAIGLLSRRHARNVLGVDVTFLPLIRRKAERPFNAD